MSQRLHFQKLSGFRGGNYLPTSSWKISQVCCLYICNHFCLDDILHTKKPSHHSFGGVLGFCFTNSFLTQVFCNKNIEHNQFKMVKRVWNMSSIYHKRASLCETRRLFSTSEDPVHNLVKLSNCRKCYFCCHGYAWFLWGYQVSP